MPVHTEWVRFGPHAGYLARPGRAVAPLPAVLVIQEVWGVDDHIEDVTRRLAAAGYAAFAPDLFWEGEGRPAVLARERVAEVQVFLASLPPTAWSDEAVRAEGLALRPTAEAARIEATRQAIMAPLGRLASYVPLLRDAVRHLRGQCPATLGQPVACIGFCMGGGLTALLACEEPELAGAAIFYGSAPPLDKVKDIACPVMGFYGGLDARINAGLPAFAEAMAVAGKRFEYQVYEGAAHAFFNDARPVYHAGAARDAFSRLLTFLRSTAGA